MEQPKPANARLYKLCVFAVRNNFDDLASRFGPSDTLIASYNGAGSISLKLFARSNALLYTRQFSLFDAGFALALFGVDWPNGPGGKGSGFEIVPRFKSMLQNAVLENDAIGYYYKEVFK